MVGQLWEVVGGQEQGGILVREGCALSTQEVRPRLATGALVEELEFRAERLRYRKRGGEGPDEGWVSLTLKTKSLLVRRSAAAAGRSGAVATIAGGLGDAAVVAASASKPSVQGKARVLVLHGGGMNSTVMKPLCRPLMKAFGDSVHCDFLEGPLEWTMEVGHRWGDAEFIVGPAISAELLAASGSRYDTPIEADPYTVALSRGEPWRGWYNVTCEDSSRERDWLAKLYDPAVRYSYDKQLDAQAERILRHLEAEGPFDALLTYSNASVVAHVLTGLLRERGKDVPWKLSVMFNPFPVRDPRFHHLLRKPLAQPVVLIFGKTDWAYEYARDSVSTMYESPVVLEHDQGHQMPSKQPAAQEIYARVAAELTGHCGTAGR